MIRTREVIEEQEARALASFAQLSSRSAGRKHPEPPARFRTEYQRDSARVIHSRAFRRLEYKTQVFLNGSGDHLRTRLTHTMEVTSISRAIARALGLNEDLAEAIALAHDIGHAPFGHSGEETLNEAMAGHGGFSHNAQSQRILERLEKKYPGFQGLNLTFELLEGLQKHRALHADPNKPASDYFPGGPYPCPTLEAQAADLADEIAYYSHDLDDGLESGLIRVEQLADLTAWRESYEPVRAHNPEMRGRELHAYVIRCLIDRETADVIAASDAALRAAGITSVGQARGWREPLIRYSPEMAQANRQLREFLYANLYYHPQVVGVNRRACEMLRELFNACVRNPALLSPSAAARVAEEGLHRSVCDYLAGMTDRYLLEAYERIGHN